MMVQWDELMGALVPMLQACTEGRGETGVINGAVGLGKTALIEALADRGTAEGFLVFTAVGSRSLGSSPYQLLDELFHGTEVEDAAAGARATADVRAYQADGVHAPAMPQVAQTYHRALGRLSSRRPVMICVDDVQHFDPQSVQCLLHLVQRCRRMPVVIFLTCGSADDMTQQALLAELACRPGVRRVRLRTLVQHEVRTLIADRFGPAAADRFAFPFFDASGGNHLLVQALLDDQASLLTVDGTPQDGDAIGVGDVFRAASLACVHRSGAKVLRVARGVAVLDGVGPPTLLTSLVELEKRAVDNAVRVLNESGLLHAGRFRSPAVRDAVLADIPLAERTDLHRRAGGLLADEGEQALVVAPHLLAAGAVDGDRVVAVLLEAAKQAIAEDDVSLATRSLQLADRCCEDARQRHQIQLTLAQVLWRDRPEASTRMMWNLVGAANAGLWSASARLTVAQRLLVRGHVLNAVDLVERISPTEQGVDEQSAVEAAAIRMWMSSTCPGLMERLEPPAELSAPQPAAVADLPGMARLTSMRSLRAVLNGSAEETDVVNAERVLQSLPLGDATMDTLCCALVTLVYADRLKTAGSWCDSFLRETAERNAPTWQVMLASVRALISLRQGRLQQAAELAARAFSGLSQEAWGVVVAMPLSTLVAARTAIGDHDEAAQLLKRPVPDIWLQTRFGVHFLYARGQHYLARGCYDLALADFLACGEKLRTWRLDSPVLEPWRTGVVQVLLRRGQHAQAADLAAEHLALVRQGQRRTHGVALRTLAATRRPAERLELLAEALKVLQSAGDSFEAALTLADLGRAQQDCGARDEARLTLRRAWHLAKECGATELASSLTTGDEDRILVMQQEFVQTDAVDATALSKAEMRVSALAAEGYTNREISRKLFITVSTVEQHLTRVYRKLNIRHRRDLPDTLLKLQSCSEGCPNGSTEDDHAARHAAAPVRPNRAPQARCR